MISEEGKGTIEHAKKVFHLIAIQCRTFDEMDDLLNNKLSEGIITQEEYDYIQKNWNNLL